MTVFLLKEKCPKCGGTVTLRNACLMGNDIPDKPDVPWVFQSNGFNAKRFDTCINGHYFNIRPDGDHDEHYIYEHELHDEISKLQARLASLFELEKG